MRRTIALTVTLLVCLYLDSFFFNRFNLYGIRPDMLMAAVAAIGVLFGSLPAMISGGVFGLLMDIVFNKAVGLSTAAYISIGAIAGIFYKKFYADNPVVPAILAAVASFVKEHLIAVFVLIIGGSFSYLDMLASYIIPGALLTSGFCVLIYFILKRVTRERLYHLERNMGGTK